MTPVRYMLDTNMVSYIARGRSREARRHLANLKSPDIACISAITAAEIHYGLAKKPEATALAEAMRGALAHWNILVWDDEAAQVYGTLRTHLEATGQTLGSMDLLILAHAIATSAILVTHDKALQDAALMKRLKISAGRITDWATDL